MGAFGFRRELAVCFPVRHSPRCPLVHGPDSFRPDRFAPDNFGDVQRTAYLPLGLGPHVCIGKVLSTIVLTTILACILQEFRVSLTLDQPDLRPEVGIVVKPRSDLGFTPSGWATSEELLLPFLPRSPLPELSRVEKNADLP